MKPITVNMRQIVTVALGHTIGNIIYGGIVYGRIGEYINISFFQFFVLASLYVTVRLFGDER